MKVRKNDFQKVDNSVPINMNIMQNIFSKSGQNMIRAAHMIYKNIFNV